MANRHKADLNDINISNLYLPENQRKFKKKEKKKSKRAIGDFPEAYIQGMPPKTKHVQFDSDLMIDDLKNMGDMQLKEVDDEEEVQERKKRKRKKKTE